MMRKPVILTSNFPVWRYILNERQPLMNRMFTYLHLRKSPVAALYSTMGQPNYKFLQSAFRFLEQDLRNRDIPENEELYKKKLFPALSASDLIPVEMSSEDSSSEASEVITIESSVNISGDTLKPDDYPFTPPANRPDSSSEEEIETARDSDSDRCMSIPQNQQGLGPMGSAIWESCMAMMPKPVMVDTSTQIDGQTCCKCGDMCLLTPKTKTPSPPKCPPAPNGKNHKKLRLEVPPYKNDSNNPFLGSFLDRMAHQGHSICRNRFHAVVGRDPEKSSAAAAESCQQL